MGGPTPPRLPWTLLPAHRGCSNPKIRGRRHEEAVAGCDHRCGTDRRESQGAAQLLLTATGTSWTIRAELIRVLCTSAASSLMMTPTGSNGGFERRLERGPRQRVVSARGAQPGSITANGVTNSDKRKTAGLSTSPGKHPRARAGQGRWLDRSSRPGQNGHGDGDAGKGNRLNLATTDTDRHPRRILVRSGPLTSELSPGVIRWRCEEHRSSQSPRAGSVVYSKMVGHRACRRGAQ